jgi:copper chaperone CopZ
MSEDIRAETLNGEGRGVATRRTEILRVADMTCVSCERKIEKKLKGTEGVIDAKASFSDGSVHVTYDPDVIDVGAMEKIIEKMDYHIKNANFQYNEE